MLAMSGEIEVPSIPLDWHALQEWLALGPTKVTIPFGPSIAKNSRGIVPRMSRDFQNMMSLVRAHALLHRKTRKRKAGKIVAEIRRLRAVWKLVGKIIEVGVEATVAPEFVKRSADRLQAWRAAEPWRSLTWRRNWIATRPTFPGAWPVLLNSAISRNLETCRGTDANIVVGDPLPEDVKILPSPNKDSEALQGAEPEPLPAPKKDLGRKPGSR